MFAKACSIAREYTFPIIISQKNEKGICGSGIGSFVVINEEGWFVTAYHIISQIQSLGLSLQDYNQLLAKRQTIDANSSIKKHEQMRLLKPLRISPDAITNFSYWFGWDNVGLEQNIFILPEIDLAIGKLSNFDKNMVKNYPQFKDPAKPMEQGTSLCKLGFPFHAIVPTFDNANNRFNLPPGAVPPPFFPIEGIYTRTITVPSANPKPYPFWFIETSSPGLRGQSGGPTFDIHGAIWAIQSSTQHHPLGFGENHKGSAKEAEHLKNQYLNVGLGIHSMTIISFLQENSISFHLSPV